MFAFLLMVPFSQGWPKTTDVQQKVYFASFLCTTVATLFLIAPTTYHRLRWRAQDKEHLLKASNLFAIAGTAFLAVAMSCVVYFVTDYIFPSLTAIVSGVAAGAFAFLWFGYPLLRGFRGK